MRPIHTKAKHKSIDIGLNAFLLEVYKYMGLGLALTAGVALTLSLLPLSMRLALSGFSLFAVLASFGIVMYMSAASFRLSFTTLQTLFWSYAALTGVSLTYIFQIYRAQTISTAFFVTAMTFGASAFYGHITKKDLTSVGSFCMMGLWGLLAAGIVNIFMGSGAISFLISLISVVVFVGLTAYQTQGLTQIYYEIPHTGDAQKKVSIFGALNLYTSFLNLFLAFLRLLNSNNDR